MKKIALYLLSFLFLLMQLPNASASNKHMMNEVYTRLQAAIGDNQREWPALEIRPGASSVLAYNQRKNTIYVDERALDVCAAFGSQQEDAFAFLLAHEITHFYQEHHWKEAGFATSFLTNKNNFDLHIVDEKEADLFGAFLTHLAGYQSVKIVPAIFDKVYAAYGLQEDLAEYPSLSQRKATALEVCNKVNELIQVFETANYLVALGEYTAAAAAYEHILQFVKLKELYNNIGASLVAAAALQPDYGSIAFRYPIELDLDIPLREGVDAAKTDLLQKAIEYLTIASQLDNQHYAVFINLTCAFLLDNQLTQAHQLISQLKGIIQTQKQRAELHILQGIVQAKQSNLAQAHVHFKDALQSNQEAGIQQLATYNQQLLNGETTALAASFTAITKDQIDGIDLTYQNDFPFTNIPLQDHFSYDKKQLAVHATPKASLVHLETADKTIAILTTSHPKQLTQKNIGIGASIQQVQQLYNSPNAKSINHSKGYFLVLPQQKLLFNFNAQNNVIEWGIYEVY